jgi:hypothetical protein
MQVHRADCSPPINFAIVWQINSDGRQLTKKVHLG